MKLPAPRTAKTIDDLYASLLQRNWREIPSTFDIPANSQIFGQLVRDAGIDGIIYPSTKTGKDCLVLVPENFLGGDAYIQLDDEPPHQDVIKRIDATNWGQSLLSGDELRSNRTSSTISN